MANNNMDVSSFISNFQGGGLRPNLFKVVLTFPNEVGGQQASNKIMFSCKATSLPASQIGVVNAPYMGRVAKFAGDRVFDDWNITVLLDTDMISRDAFEKWSDLVNGHVSNVAIPGWGNPSNYMASAEVYLLDREGNTVQKYTIQGTFPINVGEIQLAWDSNDQIAELPCTMAVQYWTSESTTNV